MSSQQILDILGAGRYDAPSGKSVSIAQAQADSETNTRLYSPDELEALRRTASGTSRFSTSIQIIDATTQEAGALWAPHEGVVLLNFASARNPGGGFLTGEVAQSDGGGGALDASGVLATSSTAAWPRGFD